jgi:hypothetical protein
LAKAIEHQTAQRELGDLPKQLAALERMTRAELAQKYRELYGEPPRTPHKVYLRKRLAWRIQELAEGGMSDSALEQIGKLGDGLPERWRMRLAAARGEGSTPNAVASEPRDPRVPAVGTVLRRVFDGETHEVTVCPDGFEYRGAHYRTLSAVAKHITGTPWNGFGFFRLSTRGPARAKGASDE